MCLISSGLELNTVEDYIHPATKSCVEITLGQLVVFDRAGMVTSDNLGITPHSRNLLNGCRTVRQDIPDQRKRWQYDSYRHSILGTSYFPTVFAELQALE
jgi:hypothetical protein